MMDTKLHILQHSLGCDKYGMGGGYRNHFVADRGTCNYNMCMELVSDDLMRIVDMSSELTGGGICFTVTLKGMKFIRDYSPPPPKRTS